MISELKPITYSSWQDDEVEKVNRELGRNDTLDVLRWAYQAYENELVYSCSFGAEGMVLIDLISRVRPYARILFLDTGVHFPQTIKLISQVKEKYPGLKIDIIQSSLTLQEQEIRFGSRLWESNPDLCCRLRKVNPLQEALNGTKAWISGLRREQSPSRAGVQFVNLDTKFHSVKICPLIHWKWEDIWNYIEGYKLPYNPLHDQNYPSIGCETCTLPMKDGKDSRSGRWAGFHKNECGLHQG